jgi:proteasome lid subunit RPN8/RPN11
VLTLAPEALAELRRHGEEAYPHESCGLLVGRQERGGRAAAAAVRCGNDRRDSPANRYAIDPREILAAERAARARGQEIVGFYHSHPDHPARWSPTDLAEAHWLGCSYVITRVAGGRAEVTRSFVLAGTGEEDKRFDEEEIRSAAGASLQAGGPP